MFSFVFLFPTVLVIQKAYHQNASGFHFEEQQWPAKIDIASSNFVENGSMNYCGNFTTFSITSVSPIEISVLKQSLIWGRFLSLHSLSSLIIRLLKIHIPQSLIKLSILCLLCCCLITFFGWFLGVLKDQWWLRVCTRICMTYFWRIKP